MSTELDSLFTFKQKSYDFIVKEKLPFELKGSGDLFFVYFEKRNLNTMDVIDYLTEKLKLSRVSIGIAGLKDKKAITLQRMCIYKSALKKIGGEKIFLNVLSEIVKIVETNRHDEVIKIGTPIVNVFEIRLRAKKKLSQDEKLNSRNYLNNIMNEGFPNFFGEQRFGFKGRNRRQGKDFLNGIGKIVGNSEIVFKLQAYGSKLFNDYLKLRLKGGVKIIDGDLLHISNSKEYIVYEKLTNKFYSINQFSNNSTYGFAQKNNIKDIADQNLNITGPVLGYNLLFGPQNSISGKLEFDFFKKNGINDNIYSIYEKYKIFGIRRSLWAYPQNYYIKFISDDIIISFTLESGIYASVIIDKLLNGI